MRPWRLLLRARFSEDAANVGYSPILLVVTVVLMVIGVMALLMLV